MSEHIISDKQLGLIRDFATVCVEGEKLPRIVRCRDCVRYSLDDYGNTWCADVASAVQPDDFCAWGEKAVS